MTWLVLILLPGALLLLSVQAIVVGQLWRARRELPRFRDMRRGDQLAVVGASASAVALVAAIELGYGEMGAEVLLVVFGSVAAIGVAMVPFMVWVGRRGSPELQQRFLGRPRPPE